MRNRILLTVPLAVVGLVVAVPAGSAVGADGQGVAASGVAASAVVDDAGAAPVAWAPCPDQSDVECGTVTVPVDWARPGGDTIEVALARRRATDPARRIGSLLIDPGGPGGSGVNAVKGDWFTFSPAVTERFDLVGFDPRGVGASQPVLCDPALIAELPDEVPTDQAEFDALVSVNRRFADSCRRLTGPVFDHVDSVSVARDIEAVRRALGDGKLNYYGTSYGTLMGEEYLRLFGSRVRTMVLDGVLDHSIRSTGELMRTASTASEESFTQFAEWCARDPECALHGREIRVPASMAARWDVNQLLYAPAWRQLATMLAESAPPVVSTPAGTEPVPSVHQAVICQDWRFPVRSYAELSRLVGTVDAPNMRLSPTAWSMIRPCIGWTGPVPNPQHPVRWRDAPPVLMLTSRYDPATGYQWATSAARQSGAALVTYDGWGHGAYWKGSTCVTGATDRYLLTGEARSLHCPAVPPTG